MAAEPKREDRRTRYTKMVIHDAFFELLEERGFEKVSITDICKIADVNRGTFYLHYEDKFALLDEIIDEALDADPKMAEGSAFALGQHVPTDSKYRPLYTDPAMLSRLTQHVVERGAETAIPQIMEKTGLSHDDAKALFVFVAHGNIALNQSLGWKKNMKTEHVHELVNIFTDTGFKSLQNLGPRR